MRGTFSGASVTDLEAKERGASETGWEGVGIASEPSSESESCNRYAGSTTGLLSERSSACGGSDGARGDRDRFKHFARLKQHRRNSECDG